MKMHLLMRNIFPASSAEQFLAHPPPLGLQRVCIEREVNNLLKVTILTFVTSVCYVAQEKGTARPIDPPARGGERPAAQLAHQAAALRLTALAPNPLQGRGFYLFSVNPCLFVVTARGMRRCRAAPARATSARGRPCPRPPQRGAAPLRHPFRPAEAAGFLPVAPAAPPLGARRAGRGGPHRRAPSRRRLLTSRCG